MAEFRCRAPPWERPFAKPRPVQLDMSLLWYEVQACLEEVAALRDCLVEAHVLSPDRFSIHMHRRKFANALRLHGFKSEMKLNNVLSVDGVGRKVGNALGLSGMQATSATSSAYRRSVSDLMTTVSTWNPIGIYVLGGSDGLGPVEAVHQFEPRSYKWFTAPQLPRERGVGFTVATLDEHFYVCGGATSAGESKAVDRFSVRTQTWEQVRDMLSGRAYCSACGTSSRIYVCGGTERDAHRAEFFTPKKGRWDEIPCLIQPRERSAAASIGDVVYITGGLFGLGALATETGECYDPATGLWRLIPNMPRARHSHATAAVGKRLFVCGGAAHDGPLCKVESLWTPAMRWEEVKEMEMPRCRPAAAAALGRLYVFGGVTRHGETVLSDGECYDPARGEWDALPVMPECREGHCAVAMNLRMHWRIMNVWR